MGRPKLKLPSYIEVCDNGGTITWIRLCPKCNNKIHHKSFNSAHQCHKKNRKCRMCGCSWSRGQTKDTNDSLRLMSLKVSEKMKELRRTSPPWNLGLTKESSEILERMGKNHIGFRHTEESKKIISDISKKLWKNLKYREKCLKNFTDYNAENLRKTEEVYGSSDNRREKLASYYKLVWRHTNLCELSMLKDYDKWVREGYHLDHKYSIVEGFENNVEPEIIGCIYNIQFITAGENRKKHRKCSITLEELKYHYESKS